MRIIGGRFKGRRFHPPADKWPTRPTTDFAKEALYNILMNRIDFAEISMLDLFGGTGNHSYEAISRGCEDVTYVDQHIPCLQFVRQVAKTLEIESYIKVIRSDVSKFIPRAEANSYDLIFAGPPYGLRWLDEIPDMIITNGLLKSEGVLVLEHNAHHNFEQHAHFAEQRKYGGTYFSFFSAKSTIAT